MGVTWMLAKTFAEYGRDSGFRVSVNRENRVIFRESGEAGIVREK